MRIFIGMETSGQLRRRFQALGHNVISCDTLACEDQAEPFQLIWEAVESGGHVCGDVFDVLKQLWLYGWLADFAVFHPTCTFHTVSAAWAFNDPDFVRYPGVGYHQRVRPGTLTGAARREARELAEADCERIRMLPFPKAIENPRGTLSTRTLLRKAHQVLQPYEFGDDASKGTCIWFFDENGEPIPGMRVAIDPAKRVAGRVVEWPRGSGKMVERWSNQTDENQNKLGPGEDRWKERSRTYPGIADALCAAIHAREVSNV